jgi:hypothetical protein
MEVSTIARVGTSMEQTKTAQEVSVAVLKKALDAQSSAAVALLEALPPVASSNLPSHLGQNINTKA